MGQVYISCIKRDLNLGALREEVLALCFKYCSTAILKIPWVEFGFPLFYTLS